MSAIVICGALCFVFGTVLATLFWINYIAARDEGYNRGYEQAQYERRLMEKAKQDKQDTLFGFPSAEGAKE